jgi:hypothetical protein
VNPWTDGRFSWPSGAQTTLNASAATGIRAIEDEQTWRGATDLPLPYPPASEGK